MARHLSRQLQQRLLPTARDSLFLPRAILDEPCGRNFLSAPNVMLLSSTIKN
jgi:hypothetical protein